MKLKSINQKLMYIRLSVVLYAAIENMKITKLHRSPILRKMVGKTSQIDNSRPHSGFFTKKKIPLQLTQK
jgi:hypothetical protein